MGVGVGLGLGLGLGLGEMVGSAGGTVAGAEGGAPAGLCGHPMAAQACWCAVFLPLAVPLPLAGVVPGQAGLI